MDVVKSMSAKRAVFFVVSSCLLTICGCVQDGIEQELQTILSRTSNSFLSGRMSLTLGVALHNRTISLSAGPRHDADNNEVAPSDAFAMGSAAKMYTAAAVLRLADAGKIHLDDFALPLMDTLYTKLKGKSLAKVLGPQIESVTVRQLLQMQSGIADFDNKQSRNYQFNHPLQDLGPVENIDFLPAEKPFECTPGECGFYSSTNYELLGLILAQQAGASSWDEYNQKQGLPEALLSDMKSTAFALHGPCSDYTSVHGFSQEQLPAIDVSNMSCTNGWTCGNLLSNGGDAAVFVRALLGKGDQVLSSKMQKEMLTFKPLSQGWGKGIPYGLGLMDMSKKVKGQVGEVEFIGHGGETYGFNGAVGYSRTLDVGIALFGNSENLAALDFTMMRVHRVIERYVASERAHESFPLVDEAIIV
eukprot:TRINITY_DN56265_c0_g1_i1.p1 TRINITY_DN56265_c0_g1~~TRINITY_DN56265_c0_g1_i1.p1  ORF type:complete len:417 (+),score=74.28 TRINITY_DN56265_c0_g1_i1:93-1343(+)